MSNLYYLLQTRSSLDSLEIPSSTTVKINEEIRATVKLESVEKNDKQMNQDGSRQNTVFGRITVHISQGKPRDLPLVIRMDSGVILLNAQGRAYLRRYAQTALCKALNLEAGFIPVYHENLVSLLKSMNCYSITISIPGDLKEIRPQEEKIDWEEVEGQPFVEAKFTLETDGSKLNIRLTSQTVSFYDGGTTALAGTARLIERYLLSGMESSNALKN